MAGPVVRWPPVQSLGISSYQFKGQRAEKEVHLLHSKWFLYITLHQNNQTQSNSGSHANFMIGFIMPDVYHAKQMKQIKYFDSHVRSGASVLVSIETKE